MSGFKSYKIRDGVHIPSDKYRKGWNDIFANKTQSTKGLDGASKTKKTSLTFSGKNKVTKTV